ncbi:Nuclear receptor-binding protein-like protein [Fragariocoptes setiger]|uniref:Nuclear receptor-binding protein-like protein n=1 Tax=Fragariocoptes setiger TaxID=1670756 RepID=A0ABQ7S6S7_9ACAR|nr:Nuclear receptor-binding protein-like protein [Fragariocoptes setiger]
MSGHDSEDECDVLEESPCGRWLKRKEEVEQHDVPGIDATYLAMDTEEGVEVVWNEVRFSERKYFTAREEKISEVFERLIQLDHPNIVKLHKYWMDKDVEHPRVIFITEYMSSGSLKQFLKKTKRNVIRMALPSWTRWCSQILSALYYLHSNHPSIVHGNLNCDTIFMSHNGLIKIGWVGGTGNDILRQVKTIRDNKTNAHYVAPEAIVNANRHNIDGNYHPSEKDEEVITTAADIYSFGICALEMAVLEIGSAHANAVASQANASNKQSPDGDSNFPAPITSEIINMAIDSLENPLQKDFIRRCIQQNPHERPTARDLIFHPIIFEVPSLRLIAAHRIVNTSPYQPEQLTEDALFRSSSKRDKETVLVEITHDDGRDNVTITQGDTPRRELDKFLEEVRNGVYPLTPIFMANGTNSTTGRQRTATPDSAKNIQSQPPQQLYDREMRRIVDMMCNIKPHQKNTKLIDLTLLLRMEDKMNRQLSCEMSTDDPAPSLSNELVFYGLINEEDRDMVQQLIQDTINRAIDQSSTFS